MDRRALVLVLVATAAHADKRIQQMTPGFQREARSCAIQVSGLEKVQAGGATLAPSLSPEDKATLDKDLETLAAGLAGVKTYCTAVTELVTFLEASANASYKSVEKELDTRDNAVRKLRRESKKTIETLQPITRRWIVRIAHAQAIKPDVVEAKKPATFPSGRIVELPAALTGAWRASGTANDDTLDYADKTWTANVYVRAFSGATCEQQQKSRAPKPLTTPLAKVDGIDVAWAGELETPAGAKEYQELWCVAAPSGGWLAGVTLVKAPADKLAELRALAQRMVAAQVAAPKTP